jgi:uncharacterized protein (DUF2147 family)
MFFISFASCSSASAAEVKDMIGKWQWRGFVIEVRECRGDSVCAKILAGPENVGMELFTSRLVAKGGELYGEITDPETKEKYNTRFQQKDNDRWQLDGCTATKVCLSGEFTRVR